MAVRNLTVSYAPAATVADVLNALLEAFTSTGAFAGVGLGWTQIEDSIAGSSLFVVEAQQPSELKSRMVLEVRHANIAATDYIAFILYESWTPGAPGSGTNPVQALSPSFSSGSSTASRFHRIDLTNGGNFYLDGDDATGLSCTIHSERNGVVNALGHFMSVCSVERSFAEGNLGVNYGVLAFADSGVAQYLVATVTTDTMMWVPPINHAGNSSNSHTPTAATDRAVYVCGAPNQNGVTISGTMHLTGRGDQADTYNGGELVWPLQIANMSTRRLNSFTAPAGSAFGYRGICSELFGYSQGAAIGWQSTVLDDTTGKSFLAYTTDGLDGNTVPCVMVEKA